MEQMYLRNVLVVDRGSEWNGQRVDMALEAGRISKITLTGQMVVAQGALVKEGGCISPGWVDMRCELTDPGHEWLEDLDSLSKAAIAGGFTHVLGLPTTVPAMHNAGQVRALLHRAERLPIHLHVAGAMSVGTDGKDLAELYDMQQAGAIAFTDGRRGSQSGGLVLRALQYLQGFGGLLINSPIDQALAEECMVAEGVSSVKMGLKGMPETAEIVMLERDLRLLAHYGGRLHVGPVTTAAGVNAIRSAKAAGLKVSTETSVLYLILDESENEAFDAVTKVYPPLRDRASVEALRAAVLDGTIDVVSSGHHPQGLEEKTHDFVDASFGADCLETAFSGAWTGISGDGRALEALVAGLSSGPRQVLGLPSGTISEGNEADLTHFDPEVAWTPRVGDIRSKSKFNPLVGRELMGRVLGVYVRGGYLPAF
ncbi:MAG: dihydroorotase [Bacteroidia bacterium]